MSGAGPRRGLLVFSVMLATLMQALDGTIANVALPSMQGTFSAAQDQISWVLTSYIVATVIAMPATGWLAATLGRRRLLFLSVAGFTATSVLCGMATSIEAMVLFRFLQGMFGAALVPISQSTLLDAFPTTQHGTAMAMWGMGVMLGPILGPPLGGWLTDSYSWHWAFFINLPIGAIALFGIAASLPTDETHAVRFDWRGFAFLAVGIAALQLCLDRGQQLDWFESLEIRLEAAAAFLGFYFYLVHWWTAEKPFLNLGLLTDRNFAASVVIIFILGVMLLATMALLPSFLQNLLGYPVVTTGLVIAPRGVGTLLSMMAAGRLMAWGGGARTLASVGMGLIAWSLWQMTHYSVKMPESFLISTGLVQGVGLGLVFVPISTVAYATLAPAVRTEAAGLFSLMRNLGSSVGVSVATTLLARGIQVNHAEIGARLTPFGNPLPAGIDVHSVAGLAALDAEVTRQAAAIAYLNDFWLMTWMTVLAMPLLLLIRPIGRAPDAKAAGAVLE